MIKLTGILLEKKENKESLKKNYHTYSCDFLLKLEKKINITQAIERVRGIKTVTVVQRVENPGLDSLNKSNKNFEFSIYKIKFITNLKAQDQLDKLSFEIAKSDSEKGINNIRGIVMAKPKLDTLKKLD